METNQNKLQNDVKNDDYLTIWKAEQEYVSSRWNITIFFISVSFAIFGYSFQSSLTHPSAITVRVIALFIYWFAYILFLRYYWHTKFLRSYLVQMEESKLTTLDLQSKALKFHPSSINTHHYLLGLGIIYIISIVFSLILRV